MFKFLKRKIKDVNPVAALFTLPFLLVFVMYFNIFRDNVTAPGDLRTNNKYYTVASSDYDLEMVESDGPLGLKKVYSFSLDDYNEGDILAFYNIHNFVQIFVDNELVYDFTPTTTLKYQKSLGLSWVQLNLMAKDVGKDFRIEVTPVYADTIDDNIEIMIGQANSIYGDIYASDTPVMIMCVLSWVLGLTFIVVTVISGLRMQVINVQVLYLGILAILFGLWKGLDLKLAPIIIKWNPQMMSYLSVAALSLLPVPISFYVLDEVKVYRSRFIKYSTMLIASISIVMSLLQLLSPVDMRNHLIFIHILLAWCVILAVYCTLYIVKKERRISSPMVIGTCLIGLGGLVDIFLYHYLGSSDLCIVAFTTFLVLMIVEAVRLVAVSGRSSYMDPLTGLLNRAYFMRIFKNRTKVMKDEAILMFDLNDLKLVNDTLGHEEGDRYINDFASILKIMSTNRQMVGRLGGDEFIIYFEKTNLHNLEEVISTIEKKKEQINITRKVPLSYAYGLAIANDENQSLQDLLNIADQRMYELKRKMKNEKNKVIEN